MEVFPELDCSQFPSSMFLKGQPNMEVWVTETLPAGHISDCLA